MDQHNLVPSISIANLANQRVAVVERVRAALNLLDEAQQLAKAAACRLVVRGIQQ